LYPERARKTVVGPRAPRSGTDARRFVNIVCRLPHYPFRCGGRKGLH